MKTNSLVPVQKTSLMKVNRAMRKQEDILEYETEPTSITLHLLHDLKAEQKENMQLSKQCWMSEQEIAAHKRDMLRLEEHTSTTAQAKEKRERDITPIAYDKLKKLN